jgi:DNA-binding transcriptional MerR regulator
MKLRFEKKGSGAIIFVGDIAVKASSVDRAFSMGKLCKRLGEFAPGVYPTKKAKIEPEPVSWLNKEEWKHYQRAKSSPGMTDPSMGLLYARQIRERKDLPSRLRQTLPHPPLGAAPGPIRTCPRPILNIGRHLQKLQHQKERQQLRHDLSRWKRRLSAKPRFEDWLRDRGFNAQAEQWRHRHKLENIPSAQWEAPSLPEGQQQAADPHTAYAVHRQDILQNNPDMARSPSMLDAHIALHMRENGFNREDIMEAIHLCAPETQPEHERNWQRYAERAADYAFGVQGNLWLVTRAEERKQKESAQQAQDTEAARLGVVEVEQEAPRPRMRM